MTETSITHDPVGTDDRSFMSRMRGPKMTRGGYLISPAFINQGPEKRQRRKERRKDGPGPN